MLQAGLALIAAAHPDLTVLTRDVELPVTEAAQALIARNRPTELSGIRLAAEVFAREHYKADLVIVDEARRYAVVCDVKRSIASYNAAKLWRLKAPLFVCAVVAPDLLRTRHQIDGGRTYHAAILDLSGQAELSDPDVFGINALDAFLRIDGAGAALRDLKPRFGVAVQAVLVDRLRAAYPTPIARVQRWTPRRLPIAMTGLTTSWPMLAELIDAKTGIDADTVLSAAATYPMDLAALTRDGFMSAARSPASSVWAIHSTRRPSRIICARRI
ncbi:hypothetical protein [Aliihoeflea sp. 40Bstr573]|uniref:hypothetical protein n=1 Tax=Aliihoeflea sp. 40Bstr573 TaxID=2696467 RepID=UPI00209573B4|nr:hypothetical protein [Aliihoeflea sp. 40Bstr573]MCO6388758.1 hypothetical protein [Aliihoeflea sp. 40Bstr573]